MNLMVMCEIHWLKMKVTASTPSEPAPSEPGWIPNNVNESELIDVPPEELLNVLTS